MASASLTEYSGDMLPVSAPGERYERLELLDRHAAETLNQFCKANAATSETATRLADVSLWQSIVTSIPLAVSDFLSLYVSLLITTYLHTPFLNAPGLSFRGAPALFVALTILPMAQLSGLYPGLGLSSPVEFRQVVRSLFAALVIFVAVACFFLHNSIAFILATSATAFMIAVPVMLVSRYFTRKLASKFDFWGVPVFVVAGPERGFEFFRRLAAKPEQGFRPRGVLLEPELYWGTEAFQANQGKIPTFDIRLADQAAVENGVTWVMVSACANRSFPSLDPSLAAIPNRLLLSSTQFDMGLWDRLYSVGAMTGLHCVGRPSSLKLVIKRLVDVGLSLAALFVLAPVLIAICLIVKSTSRGSVLYSQKRVGKDGKEFKAWKFRSMYQNADKVLEAFLVKNPAAAAEWSTTHKLANDPRITWIGRILRASSLDEIPQLWNVLLGDMSLVGPRPIINSPTYDAQYIEKYAEEFEVYKTVRPGLTGLWQVQCRNRGVYELRIYWDMYYIRNWCIWLDLYLIMRTVKTVLLREGS